MSRFSVGNKIIGRDNSKYNYTKAGWVGIVTGVFPKGIISAKGPGANNIIVNFTNLEEKYFDLYKHSKTNNMATKKKAAKKAAVRKATPIVEVVGTEIELIGGNYFTAEYKEPGTRRAPVRIMGQIADLSGEFYLCNNTVGEQDTSDELADSLGYGKFINFEPEIGKSLVKELASIGLTNFKICNNKRQQAIIEKTKAPQVEGYVARVEGNRIVFGCGDVDFSKTQVKSVYKALSLLSNSEISDLEDVIEDLRGQSLCLSQIDIEEVENLVDTYNL